MNKEQDHKKIVLINTVLYGSTGNIVKQLKSLAEENGMEAYTATAYARNSKMKYDDHDIVIGNFLDRYLHILLSRVTGLSGVFSVFSTLSFTHKLKRIDPDVIHLHNLHNAYINLQILFRYIRKNNIRVIWTLHDCWAFTGRCPHFEMISCKKWMNGCCDCPYPEQSYPIAKRDVTKIMWKLKKYTFTNAKDLTIVTPSKWLAGLVKQSYLGDYPVRTINNGIDLGVFKPIKGSLYDHLRGSAKYIVLGLALNWNKSKGLDIIIELSRRLGDDYQIILVGADEKVASEVSEYRIKCINRTSSQKELAELYTASDVFVNPSREDTFPTVNIEALACGTPVVTFDTGGSPEILTENCGVVVPKEDVDGLVNAVTNLCERNRIEEKDCIERARKFKAADRFREYIDLYNER